MALADRVAVASHDDLHLFAGAGVAISEEMLATSARGQSRLAGASCRSIHVRNAPLATVVAKKAACREGPRS